MRHVRLNARPRIGITVGDPAGIGPEIARKAADHPDVRDLCDVVFYGPASDAEVARFERGRVSGAAGRAAYDAIVQAADDAVHGRIDAMVTAPINKEAFAAAGLPWRGHTELLAHLTGAPRVAMMFYAESLRVILATVHIALAEVPRAITRAGLLSTLRVLHAGLRTRFRIARPRILVSGLNPHSGEAGHLGTEEREVIEPALRDAKKLGISVQGPIPADTLFVPSRLKGADCVLAMYHDQGLPVLKFASFGRGVNVTLGLPFVRTSVDHGTALEIAGQGKADAGSLLEALKLAVKLAPSA